MISHTAWSPKIDMATNVRSRSYPRANALPSYLSIHIWLQYFATKSVKWQKKTCKRDKILSKQTLFAMAPALKVTGQFCFLHNILHTITFHRIPWSSHFSEPHPSYSACRKVTVSGRMGPFSPNVLKILFSKSVNVAMLRFSSQNIKNWQI